MHEKLLELGGGIIAATPQSSDADCTIREAVDNAAMYLPLQDWKCLTGEWGNHQNPLGQQASWADPDGACAVGLVRHIVSGSKWNNNEKPLLMLQQLLRNKILPEEHFSKIDEALFGYVSRNGVGWPFIDHTIKTLEKSGWAPSAKCWTHLGDRIWVPEDQGNNSNDSEDIIIHLAEKLIECVVWPEDSSLFMAPAAKKEPRNYTKSHSDGYKGVCDWGRDEMASTHSKLVEMVVGRMPDVNACPKGPNGYASALKNAVLGMGVGDENDRDHSRRVAEALILAGADHAMEVADASSKDKDSNWAYKLPENHEYWRMRSQRDTLDLTDKTPMACQGPARAGFRL
jgi:hypothetical protein